MKHVLARFVGAYAGVGVGISLVNIVAWRSGYPMSWWPALLLLGGVTAGLLMPESTRVRLNAPLSQGDSILLATVLVGSILFGLAVLAALIS